MPDPLAAGRLDALEPRVMLSAQIITADAGASAFAPGANVPVVVQYNTETDGVTPGSQTLFGLGLRLHYNSQQLSFTDVTGQLETTIPIADVEDASDFDGDASTDRFLLLAWSDIDGQWPGVALPVTLFTANFQTAADFAGTTVNFTDSSSHPGYAFQADTLQLDPPPTAAFQTIATPTNNAVAAIVVNFSHGVSNVSLDDFTLTRDDGGNLLTVETITDTSGGAGTQYTITGLAALTSAEGQYTLTLDSGSDIVDADGLALVDPTAPAVWTMDTTPPVVNATELSDDDAVVPNDNRTRDHSPSVVFEFSEAITGVNGDITVVGPAGTVNPAAIHGFGTNELEVELPDLADGQYTITLSGVTSITDLAGNVLDGDSNGAAGGDFTYTFTLDTDAPDVVASFLTDDTGPIDDLVTSDTTPAVSVTFDQDVFLAPNPVIATVVGVTTGAVDAQVSIGAANEVVVTFAVPLAPDQYTLTLDAAAVTDDVGNPINDGIDVTVQFTVDTTAPTVLSVTPSGPVNIQPNQIVILFGEAVGMDPASTSSAGNYVLLDLGADGALGGGDDVLVNTSGISFDVQTQAATLSFAAPLPDAVYQLTLSSNITDQAGNPLNGGVNTVASLTVDTVAPVVAVDDLNTLDHTPSLTGTVNEPAAISVTIAGQTHAATDNGDGTWALADNVLTVLADGVYDVAVTATDPAGNSTTTTATGALIVLSEDGFEQDDTSGTARPIDPLAAPTQQRSIDTAGDSDWMTFTFDAATGSLPVLIQVNAEDGLGIHVAIFAADDLVNPIAEGRGTAVDFQTATLAEGTYFIEVQADDLTNDRGVVVQYDLMVASLPDLAIGIITTNLSAPIADPSGLGFVLTEPNLDGDMATVTVALRNLNALPAPLTGVTDVTVGVYLDPTPNGPDGDEVLIGTQAFNLNGLTSAAELVGDVEVTLPSGVNALPAGYYDLIARIDTTNVIDEVNETNNQSAGISIGVSRTLAEIPEGRGTRSAAVADADGSTVTIRLTGPGFALIAQDPDGGIDLMLGGATTASTAVVTAAGGNGTADLSDVLIFADDHDDDPTTPGIGGSLRLFNAPTTNLAGHFVAENIVLNTTLNNFADDHLIYIGPGASANQLVNITVNNLVDTSLVSVNPVNRLVANSVTLSGGGGVDHVFTAPSFNLVQIAGDFAVDLTATAGGNADLGRMIVGGTVADGVDLNIAGRANLLQFGAAGAVNVTAGSINRITTNGWGRGLIDSSVLAALMSAGGNAFMADLALSGDGANLNLPLLNLARIGGVLGSGDAQNPVTWSINGIAGQIIALGGTSGFDLVNNTNAALANSTSVRLLNLGAVQNTNIVVSHQITTVQVASWNGGQIDAGYITSLTSAGNLLVDINLSGSPHAAIATLGRTVVGGQIGAGLIDRDGDLQADDPSAVWDINGAVGVISSAGANGLHLTSSQADFFNVSTLCLGTVLDTAVDQFADLRAIIVNSWVGGALNVDSLQALTSNGDVNVHVILAGSGNPGVRTLGAATIRGTLGSGEGANRLDWSVDGQVARIDATNINGWNLHDTGAGLGVLNLVSANVIQDSDIRLDTALNNLTAAGLNGVRVFVGVDDAVNDLPTSAGQFSNPTNGATINRLVLTGRGLAAGASTLVDSAIAAWRINLALLRVVQTDNGGTPVGAAAQFIQRLDAVTGTQNLVRVLNDAVAVGNLPEADFGVNLFD